MTEAVGILTGAGAVLGGACIIAVGATGEEDAGVIEVVGAIEDGGGGDGG